MWCLVCANHRYQLEQQAAALAKEVSKLRAEGEQEVFLTESAGEAQMSGRIRDATCKASSDNCCQRLIHRPT
jgi:hypothetical protein